MLELIKEVLMFFKGRKPDPIININITLTNNPNETKGRLPKKNKGN